MLKLLLRLLEDYGARFAAETIGWAAAAAFGAVVVTYLCYRLCFKWRWLSVTRSTESLVGWLVLFLWLGTAVLALGTAGAFFGLERSLLHLIKTEKVVSGAATEITRQVGPALFVEVCNRFDVEMPRGTKLSDVRLPVKVLREIEFHGGEFFAAARTRLAGESVDDTKTTTTPMSMTGTLRKVIVTTGFDSARGLGADERIKYLRHFVAVVEKRAAPDGTVGVEDFASEFSTHFLEPLLIGLIHESCLYSQLGLVAILPIVILVTLFGTWCGRKIFGDEAAGEKALAPEASATSASN